MAYERKLCILQQGFSFPADHRKIYTHQHSIASWSSCVGGEFWIKIVLACSSSRQTCLVTTSCSDMGPDQHGTIGRMLCSSYRLAAFQRSRIKCTKPDHGMLTTHRSMQATGCKQMKHRSGNHRKLSCHDPKSSENERINKKVWKQSHWNVVRRCCWDQVMYCAIKV